MSELRTGMTVSRPAVSQHLAVLRGAGLVVERRAGRNAYYRADPHGLQTRPPLPARGLKAWGLVDHVFDTRKQAA